MEIKNQPHLTAEAGRAIYYFNNPLAEDLLINELNKDRDQQDQKCAKKIIANLYAAIRNMGTEKSRAALI